MHTPIAYSALEDELNEVQQMLRDAVDGLGSPLGDIVRAQARHALPLIRAATVLATAVADHDDSVRGRRITLAAALEMLHIALNVHRLLIGVPTDGHEDRGSVLDRSFVGSAILSGDYCFSRAAQFAAVTDNARVAAIFAQALQTVSEGQLRRQFDQSDTVSRPHEDETAELLRSGVLAAAALVGVAPEEEAVLTRLSQELAEHLPVHKPFILPNTGAMAALSSARAARWQALALWLSAQRVNGRIPTTSSPPLY
jgi:octaprenyl-diphosphate synthase